MPEGLNLLITGKNGRLGQALARRYARNHHVTMIGRRECDLLDADSIRECLKREKFDVLINTASLTGVDDCERHPERAATVNASAPGVMAEICAEKNARLIHVSTDYVFDGVKPGLRHEDDPVEPINVYGRSKLDGELAVLGVNPGFLVIRVSWLFGPDKPSFPDMMLKRAQQNDHVDAVADKVSCPTYSEDIAEWMEPMLTDSRYHGVLHLCNEGETTWQAYAQAVLDIAAKLGAPLKAHTVAGFSRLQFAGFTALRPEFTAMSTEKFQKLSGVHPRPWQEAIEDHLRQALAARE
jgi:dTDP-4-dehydrorhamnose reductase